MSGFWDAAVGWLPLVAALLLILAWYLSYTASRLDRLHHRVESAKASLDTQLVRRAAIAVEAAGFLDPATGLLLASAAGEVLGDEETVLAEEVENDLTRALHTAFGDEQMVHELRRHDVVAAGVLADLASACARVELARRFHNDAVAAAQRVRRKRIVRWARLAGRAPMPQMLEIDDTVPPALAPTGAAPPTTPPTTQSPTTPPNP